MGKLALFLGGFLLLTILIGLLGTIPPLRVIGFFCAARLLQARAQFPGKWPLFPSSASLDQRSLHGILKH